MREKVLEYNLGSWYTILKTFLQPVFIIIFENKVL